MQKVRLAALSLQCSSAPPSVLARRSCARFADAGVPGLLLLLCFASGLELPQMRALSIAVAIALRRHVRSCSPRVLHHTHPVDLACFVQVSMSAIQRGAVVVWHAVLPLENSVVHKIFSRGCAPHTLSLETRFSLYHIKVLHLLANMSGPSYRSTPSRHNNLGDQLVPLTVLVHSLVSAVFLSCPSGSWIFRFHTQRLVTENTRF